jgi:hypothetical protein
MVIHDLIGSSELGAMVGIILQKAESCDVTNNTIYNVTYQGIYVEH